MDIDKVLQKLHIEELNDMQKKACVTILGSTDDVVILSPTGSGKTLAYLLPTAHLVDETTDRTQVRTRPPVGKRAKIHGMRSEGSQLLWRTTGHGGTQDT